MMEFSGPAGWVGAGLLAEGALEMFEAGSKSCGGV